MMIKGGTTDSDRGRREKAPRFSHFRRGHAVRGTAQKGLKHPHPMIGVVKQKGEFGPLKILRDCSEAGSLLLRHANSPAPRMALVGGRTTD